MFNWENFLKLAKELETSVDEAKLRTAISRVYYYIFHTSEEFCDMPPRTVIPRSIIRGRKEEKSKHLRVISALRNHQDSRVRYAGSLLDSLRTWRDSADYDLNFLNNKVSETAGKATLYADEIYKNFCEFSGQ